MHSMWSHSCLAPILSKRPHSHEIKPTRCYQGRYHYCSGAIWRSCTQLSFHWKSNILIARRRHYRNKIYVMQTDVVLRVHLIKRLTSFSKRATVWRRYRRIGNDERRALGGFSQTY